MEKFVYAICKSDGHFQELLILSYDDIYEDNGRMNEDGVYELSYLKNKRIVNTCYLQKISIAFTLKMC